MNNLQINQALSQMRDLAAMAGNKPSVNPATNTSGADFSQLLKDSINKVNEVQMSASGKAASFEAGDPNVNLSEVMVAAQKAKVSFTAMIQVRNNLVSAYKDIMNMPV